MKEYSISHSDGTAGGMGNYLALIWGNWISNLFG